MFRRSAALIVAFVFIFGALGTALALDQGNKRKGKYTYRKVYKACLERGEVDSPTPPISPADKTMAQWQSIFEERKFEEFGCQQEWSALSEEEISDIYAYLYGHAADSPTPAKCK